MKNDKTADGGSVGWKKVKFKAENESESAERASPKFGRLVLKRTSLFSLLPKEMRRAAGKKHLPSVCKERRQSTGSTPSMRT